MLKGKISLILILAFKSFFVAPMGVRAVLPKFLRLDERLSRERARVE